jgi:hypothetical protein
MLLLTVQIVAGATSASASQSMFDILFGAAQNHGMFGTLENPAALVSKYIWYFRNTK